MTQPLALVFYERLLPGTQLVNRLQDLHYRVQTVTDASTLVTTARQHGAMLVLVDLQPTQGDILAAVRELKTNLATTHLPVIVFTGSDTDGAAESAAREAGASLVAQDQALLNHLPQMLEAALHVD